MGVCRFFMQGHCRYGDKCWNDHPQGSNQGKHNKRDVVLISPIVYINECMNTGSYNNRNPALGVLCPGAKTTGRPAQGCDYCY